MAQQAEDIPLTGLLLVEEDEVDNQEQNILQQQDMVSSASPPANCMMRRKCNRSPLRARAHQSSGDNIANTDLLKSPRVSPDHSGQADLLPHMHLQMKKKESEGSATPRPGHCPPHSSYTNPTFISKPTTPRDNWSSTASVLDPSHHCPERDWERIVADGKEANDGTHLIRLLADFIEDFQFGSSERGDYACSVNGLKTFPVESRHGHQLAGQLRRLADAFEKENAFYSMKERRIK